MLRFVKTMAVFSQTVVPFMDVQSCSITACVMKLATHAKKAKTGGDGGGKPEEVL